MLFNGSFITNLMASDYQVKNHKTYGSAQIIWYGFRLENFFDDYRLVILMTFSRQQNFITHVACNRMWHVPYDHDQGFQIYFIIHICGILTLDLIDIYRYPMHHYKIITPCNWQVRVRKRWTSIYWSQRASFVLPWEH